MTAARLGWLVVAAVLAGSSMAARAATMADAVKLNRQWAERVFGLVVPPNGETDWLEVVEEAAVGETKLDRCSAGGPMRLGNKVYAHGIGVNSPSLLKVHMVSPGSRFRATIGVDRNVDGAPATVVFHVMAGGADLYTSKLMKPGMAPVAIDVPLDGNTDFELYVDIGGDGRAFDQADWADACIDFPSGETVRLDAMPFITRPAALLPFSYIYGGKKSSDLLPGWKRTVKQAPAGKGALRRVITFTDPQTGLQVATTMTVYTDTPGVDWTVRFTNGGKVDTPLLEQVNALDTLTWLGALNSPVSLLRLKGSVAGPEDWASIRSPLGIGAKIDWAPSSGRSSLGASPFFTTEWGDGGVVTAIGWTGKWQASASRIEGPLRLQAGLQGLRAVLHPGESVRSPRILQVRWSGGDEDTGHNLFRRTMLGHIMPRVGGKPVPPPIAHLTDAFYETDRSTEAIMLGYVKAMVGLGFETVWHDAYFGKDDFPKVGNYVLPLQRGVNQARFPRGLKPIGNAAHAAGMKFLQWFEPERICPGTLMAAEHPDWVVIPPGAPWGGVDLGRPDAWKFVTDYIITACREYGVDQLRIDNAVDYAAMWKVLDERAGPGREGIAENRYVAGLYAMWDRILDTFPGMFIDNCASGGQRIDLETCARSIPLWRTDGTIGPLLEKRFEQAAVQNQLMSASLDRYLPYHVSGQMGATPYLWRSGFNGGIAFCEDIRPANYPRALLKQAIAEGKRIRKYFAGDYYPITDETGDHRAWCCMQFDRPEQGDGMVMAFRREQSPYPALTLENLRGINPRAMYRVTTSKGYTPSAPTNMTGKALLALRLAVEERPGSCLVEYRLVPTPR